MWFSGQTQAHLDGSMHYSFDYAQQVFYPTYAQQVGPMFFKTPRKCACFGVCCEASGKTWGLKLSVYLCTFCSPWHIYTLLKPFLVHYKAD